VKVAGRPLVAWCVDAFATAASIGRLVIAAPPGHEDELAATVPEGVEAEVVAGGESRSESVARALAAATSELVAVHDAARPLVTAELIDAVLTRLVAEPDAAGVIAAAPITDTVKRADRIDPAGPPIAATERRDHLWAAQTPQAFRAELLRRAHAVDAEQLAGATDDAMLIESLGGTVLIEPAPRENLKVTTPADLRFAELLLA
jgi:2-C-methyl-D-erythritol 4-phosphate cytidylyltransferase